MIAAGELRGRTQPTILLRLTAPVEPAPGNTDSVGASGTYQVFQPGVVVFAQYIGNGRLLLDPIDKSNGGPQVVMGHALNAAAEIIPQAELARAFRRPDADVTFGDPSKPTCVSGH